MARLDSAHPANASGDWFVDTRCIDCDTCRQFDGALFVARRGQSVVGRQPAGAAELHRAWLAAEACPTQSIGARSRPTRPSGLFPLHLEAGVHLCGHNAESSFGASSYFVVRPEGNVLVDSPRFTRRLADPLAELGGVDHVLLTHRDDVADAARWADRFGARVWIHAADAGAAPFATDVVSGHDDVEVQPGLVLVPVPGHTRGSVAYVLEERFLFSGDSLAWDRDEHDLAAFEHATWFSWPVLTESLARLAGRHRFEWVLPGHGDRERRPADEMHARLVALVERMRRG